MRMIGLSEGAYWASYLVLFALAAALGAAVAVVCMLMTQVTFFREINIIVALLIFFVFIVSMSCVGAFFSSFVARPVMTNIVSFMLFTLVALLGLIFGLAGSTLLDSIYGPEGSLVSKIFVILMPWLSFIRVWQVVSFRIGTAPDIERFGWDQFFESGRTYAPAVGDPWDAPSAGFSFLMMLSAWPIYLLLAWYFGQAFGGVMRQSIIFPFLPGYWGCGTVTHSAAIGDTVAKERLLSRRERSIRTIKLSKSYDETTALKELSVKMEPNAITCLLGHNGAGKSTLIHTLTGLHNPTHGEAFVQV